MITTTTPTSNQLIVTVDESVNIAHITRAIKCFVELRLSAGQQEGLLQVQRPYTVPKREKFSTKKTMKAIEEAEQGQGMVEVNSMENYMKLVENL